MSRLTDDEYIENYRAIADEQRELLESKKAIETAITLRNSMVDLDYPKESERVAVKIAGGWARVRPDKLQTALLDVIDELRVIMPKIVAAKTHADAARARIDRDQRRRETVSARRNLKPVIKAVDGLLEQAEVAMAKSPSLRLNAMLGDELPHRELSALRDWRKSVGSS